jgi:hypothetical protein
MTWPYTISPPGLRIWRAIRIVLTMTDAPAEHDHRIDAPHTVAEPEYSAFGHVFLAIGISADPILIRFRCKLCGKVFAETRDPGALKKAG